MQDSLSKANELQCKIAKYYSFLLFFSLLIQSHAIHSCLNETNNIAWNVSPSSAYSWSYPYPQGCICKKSSSDYRKCELFDCPCICDLSAGKCDYNCCCDQDCTTDETSRFQTLDVCEFEGPIPRDIVSCYEKRLLSKVNPKGTQDAASTAQMALDNFLCVQHDNSVSKGNFFLDPGLLKSSSIAIAEGNAFSSYERRIISTKYNVNENDGFYDKGDFIRTAYLNLDGTSFHPAYHGNLPFVGPDDGGACSEYEMARFEEDELCQSCIRTSIYDDCPVSFGANRLSSNIYISTKAVSIPITVPDDGTWVKISTSSVTFKDWDTGKEKDFGSDYNCDAFYYPGNGASPMSEISNCTIGSSDLTFVKISNSSPAACYSALNSINYIVTHDGKGKIESVDAKITVTNIPLHSLGFTAMQTFSFQYISTALMSSSNNQGNLVERARSGNPGYIRGLPLISGKLNNQTIEAPQKGLSIIGGGECISKRQWGISFSHDALGCCSLVLSQTELEQFCNGNSQYVDSVSNIPTPLSQLNALGTYIGIYGNADPADKSQWLPADLSNPINSAVWHDSTSTCKSVTANLNWRFLWGYTGAVSNPQAKILAADGHYTSQDWTWDNHGDIHEKKTFLLCSSVSFVEYKTVSTEFSPPPPSVPFGIPWDIFYPFYVHNSAPNVAIGTGYYLAVLLIVVVIGILQ